MNLTTVRADALLECLVALLQVSGVVALLFARISPTTIWGRQARVALLFTLVGLGVLGALCSAHDSKFALFAGGTLTLLLIGLTMGSVRSEHADHTLPGDGVGFAV